MPSAVDIGNKRMAVKKAYDNRKWSTKVDKMTDQQVVAIYLRLKSQGTI